MSDDLTIYQINAQSADKLDERRDNATRSHGGLCVVITAAAVGAIQVTPLLSAVLSIFLVLTALSWLAVIDSLTAKLTAKNKLLTEMESDGKIAGTFLIRERKEWKQRETRPLQAALRLAPKAFALFGTLGFLLLVVYMLYTPTSA